MNPKAELLADSLEIVIPVTSIRETVWSTLATVRQAAILAGIPRISVMINAGKKGSDMRDQFARRMTEQGQDPALIDWKFADTDNVLPMFKNWNHCVRQSAKPLVHIMHDDDELSPYFYMEIERMVALKPDAALYATGFQTFGAASSCSTYWNETGHLKDARDLLLRFCLFSAPGVVIRKDQFEGFDEDALFLGDWRGWFRTALKHDVVVSREKLIYYRQHAENATKSFWNKGANIRDAMECEIRNCREYEIYTGEKTSPSFTYASMHGYWGALGALKQRDYVTVFHQAFGALRAKFSLKIAAKIASAVITHGCKMLIENRDIVERKLWGPGR